MSIANSGFDFRRRVVLALICVALGVASLDISMVTIAVPSIHDSLRISDSGAVWIAGGLSLVMGLTLIPSGRVGDRLGHHRVFVVGLLLFGAGSLWAGLSPDEFQIVSARVVQGLGAGMIFPAGGALIQLLFEGKDRVAAFGARGAVISASSAFGGIVAGVVIWLAGPDLGWRWLFFINVPIVVVVAIGAWVFVPRQERRAHRGSDGFGLLLLTVALIAILVPVIEGSDLGWPWWMIVMLAGGLALVVVFAFWERWVVAHDRTPLVPPALFEHRTFTGGIVVSFLVFAASTSFFFGLSIFWQGPLGRSAVEMALTAAPFAVGAVGGSVLSPRIGRRRIVVGCLLAALGISATWLLTLLLPGDQLNAWTLLLPTLIGGFGQGIFIALIIDYVIRTVPPEVAGGANGLLTMMQRLGAAVGVAVVAVVFAADGGAAAIGTSALFSVSALAVLLALPKAPRATG